MRVFLASPWIPTEWIRAHGLEPRAVWFEENIQPDALPLTAGVCAFAERVVRLAETQPDSGFIFTTACDQLRRGYDVATLHGQSRSFLFNLPATQTATAKQIYRAELERLGQFLLELGGSAPKPGRLREQMLQADATRHRLREAAPNADARSFARSLARFHSEGIYSAPSVSRLEKQARLALVGGPLSSGQGHLFDAIEAAGGRVVLNATESGERNLCPKFDLDAADDPYDALVNGYFENITDVFQRPNTRLYSWLKPQLDARRVRGLVLCHFTGCDLWHAETQTLREFSGLPVLLLEAGEAPGLSPRDLTRLQAFVEMQK